MASKTSKTLHRSLSYREVQRRCDGIRSSIARTTLREEHQEGPIERSRATLFSSRQVVPFSTRFVAFPTAVLLITLEWQVVCFLYGVPDTASSPHGEGGSLVNSLAEDSPRDQCQRARSGGPSCEDQEAGFCGTSVAPASPPPTNKGYPPGSIGRSSGTFGGGGRAGHD